MNPIEYAKLVGAAAVLVIFLLLSFGTYYYHNAYIKSEVKLSVAIASNTSMKDSLEKCSANTAELESKSKERMLAANLAVAEAKKDSKKNQSKAQTILISKPKSEDLCKESNDLINQYLTEIGIPK